MRLESITVRHYRTHRARTVELDRERTLIGGPNESGKSTLIEAAHRALFVRATTGGDFQRSMRSHTHGGQPEVELKFEARGRHWHLLKRFTGSTGTATLTEIGGQTWTGDAAETQLGSLLGCELLSGTGARKAATERWAHVWVWQGCAGEDPSQHATTHCADLVTLLQSEGGAAAVQSACDRQIADGIAAQFGELFTDKREPRAGSPLFQARREEALAQAALTTAKQQCERLERAAADYMQAEKDIVTAKQALAQVRPQLQECEAKLRRVAELQAEEKGQIPAATIAADQHQALLSAHDRIAKLRTEQEKQRAALEPLVQQTEALAQTAQERQAGDEQAEQALQRTRNAERDARLRRDLAAAQVQRLEKQQLRAQLAARLQQVQELRAELTTHQTALAQIASIAPKKLTALRALESECRQAEAARDAMAAGVDVIAGSAVVRIGTRTLAAGDSALLTEQTEIEIGDAIRLRIRPGGGDSLQQARERVRLAHAQLQRDLDALGVASVAAAEQAAAQRQKIEPRIEAITELLTKLEAAKLEKEFAATETACAAAEADVARRAEQVPDFVPPSDTDGARDAKAAADETLQNVEAAATAANVTRQRAAEHLRSAREALDEHRRGLEKRQQEVTALGTQLKTLLEEHGGDQDRTDRLQEFAVKASKAEAALAETRRALAELQPQLLTGERERLERAIRQHTEAETAAQNRHALAQGELKRDGTTDPHADLAAATDQLRLATERRQRAQREADALALLHDLFVAEQKALADHFTQPLAARIGVYLECLYGPGARAEVTYDSSEFSGLRLFRPRHGGAAHSFDELSGGAREQLAAAVRLALAEVLAQSHDGCLPVVFDDAFAYSDSDRVQVLQRMLDVAATRGLQIIVLSCNPADYAALGAKPVTLRIDPPSLATAPAAFPDAESDEADTAPAAGPVTAEQRAAFLEKLHGLGGKSGNTTLCRELGWSEETYKSVKDALVGDASVLAGKGKGGSVRLPDTPA